MRERGERMRESKQHQDVRKEAVDFHDRSGESGVARPGRGDLNEAEHIQGPPAREHQRNACDCNRKHQHIESDMGELRSAHREHAEPRLFGHGFDVDPTPSEAHR